MTRESIVVLPEPKREGTVSVEETLSERRSIREYSDSALDLHHIGQLLWAGQGVSGDKNGRLVRTAPSAGARYPLETYLVAGDIEGLKAGIYHYRPESHTLLRIQDGDVRQPLYDASLKQDMVLKAPATIVFTAVLRRTMDRYGLRGRQYVHMDVGCAAENVALQAVALGLGTVFIGAFTDDGVRTVLGCSGEEVPVCILPIGMIA